MVSFFLEHVKGEQQRKLTATKTYWHSKCCILFINRYITARAGENIGEILIFDSYVEHLPLAGLSAKWNVWDISITF